MPGFTNSACGQFKKNTERIQKFKETEYSRYIYQNELDKACFQHDTACGDIKDLHRICFFYPYKNTFTMDLLIK